MNVDLFIYVIALYVYFYSIGVKLVEIGLVFVLDRLKKLLFYIRFYFVKYIFSMFICILLYDM